MFYFAGLLLSGLVTLLSFQNCSEYKPATSSVELDSIQTTPPETLGPDRELLSSAWKVAGLNNFTSALVYFDNSKTDPSAPVALNIDETMTPINHLTIEDNVFASYLTNAPIRLVLDSATNSYDLLFLSDSGLDVIAVNVTNNVLKIRWEARLRQAVTSQIFKLVQKLVNGTSYDLRIGGTYLSTVDSSNPVAANIVQCSGGSTWTHNVCIPGPSTTPNPLAYKQIEVANGRPCALNYQGQVFCWGNVVRGSMIPTLVPEMPVLSQLARGYSECGITNTGTVGCLTSINPTTRTFNEIPNTMGSKQLSSYCVIDSQDKVACWTYKAAGSLMLPTSGAAPLGNLANIKQLSVGALSYNSGCAVDFAGKVYCWGSMLLGGNPAMAPIPNLNAVKYVSAGGTSVCVIDVSDDLYCWGNNYSGQIGNGSSSTSEPRPVLVSGVGKVKSVSVGGFYACAIDLQNKAFCWGNNPAGELGIGTNSNVRVPTAVVGIGPVKQISTGMSFSTAGATTCALDMAGKSYCWGYGGANGLLGDGTTNSSNIPVATK